jgi:epoxyqueuosine reductase
MGAGISILSIISQVIAFDAYLLSLNLKIETEREFGITALRWAAYKAGLGTIRKNNFFYTDNGSWVYLEAWLTDAEMELKHENDQKPCPPECNKCIASCPTKSLCEPYTMSRAT